jgi:hypothetical protein
MSRTDQRRRRALRAAAPVAGLLAVGLLVWQGSSAAFSATTVNSADTWASGQLALTNNGGTGVYAASTAFLFGGATEQNLKIGSTGTQCLTVQSTGTLAGALKFYTTNPTGDVGLGGALKLTIDAAPVAVATNVAANCAGFPAVGVVSLGANVALTAQPTTYAGAATSMPVAAGAQRVAYRFTWTLVTTGSNATDNAIQGKSTGADFNFEIQ